MQLINHPSIVRAAELKEDTLRLTIVLYNSIRPPQMAEPVLELDLHGCRDREEARTARSTLDDTYVWNIKQEETGAGHVATFFGKYGEIARVAYQTISTRRRPFGQQEWEALIADYEEWLEKEQTERRRLRNAILKVEAVLRKRKETARRILEHADKHPERAKKSKGTLRALTEIENVLKSALGKDAS